MNNIAVKLSNITKHFPVNDQHQENDQIKDGKFYALDDISLSIEEGACAVFAGANGSGKSLLMSIIARLEEPDSGTVETSARTGLVFQEPDAQILGETAREDIAFGPLNLGYSKKEIFSCVEDALTQTGLNHRADFPSHSLSGGEKRRLAAAGVLAMNAQIIIFDEPYANLDYPGVVQVNRLFQQLKNDKKTLIILTHELEKCLALASHFFVLYKGKKVFDGSASDALMLNLEDWGIHHPLKKNTQCLEDLLW
ncbi:MAG: energy-coupling factor ABC transporter ATP-binding protein [Treponema sp.]|nr:energy-coupling factor ABC transporter ATP-binding protein [Treponema sp.]MCL2251521.1 energy-coupling factor ABC transporter ATP-binding protein [Treponema sp.]